MACCMALICVAVNPASRSAVRGTGAHRPWPPPSLAGPSCPGASHSQKPKPCARVRYFALRRRCHGQAGFELHTCQDHTEHALAGALAPAATPRGHTRPVWRNLASQTCATEHLQKAGLAESGEAGQAPRPRGHT
jgi:hypothetical protein